MKINLAAGDLKMKGNLAFGCQGYPNGGQFGIGGQTKQGKDRHDKKIGCFKETFQTLNYFSILLKIFLYFGHLW